MPMIRGDAKASVLKQRILAFIGNHFDLSRQAVEPELAFAIAFGSVAMNAGERRRIANFPKIASIPKCRNAQKFSSRVGEKDIERNFVERISDCCLRPKGDSGHLIRSDALRVASERW